MWHITQPAAAAMPRAVVRKVGVDAEMQRYLDIVSRLPAGPTRGLVTVFDDIYASLGTAEQVAILQVAVGGAPLSSLDNLIDWETVSTEMANLLSTGRRKAFEAGVAMAAEGSGVVLDVVPSAIQATIDSHAAQAAARTSDLIREITTEQRILVGSIVQQGITQQMGVPAIAQQLRNTIGLTQRQAGSVLNFGSALERYAAGDMSLDAVRSQYQLARGIRIPAKGLTQARINQLTQAYRQRWVKHRATTIARTETMHALHAGKMAQWDAMQRQGLISQDLVLEWIVTPDERLCQICMPAHGEQVKAGDIFSTGVPRPPAHPMCRCDVRQVRSGPARSRTQVPSQVPGSAPSRQGFLASQMVMPPAPGTRPGVNGLDDYLTKHKSIVAARDARNAKRKAAGTVVRGEDDFMRELQAMQGFSEKPKLVSKADLDGMLARGELSDEVFRGLPGKDFTDAYMTGEHFAGQGIYGSGTYTTTASRTAIAYSDADLTVMRMGLPKSAAIINHQDLMQLKHRLLSWIEDMRLEDLIDLFPTGKERTELRNALLYLQDEGRLATVLGYDGIRVNVSHAGLVPLGAPGTLAEDYIVVLNRSKMLVQDELVDTALAGVQ